MLNRCLDDAIVGAVTQYTRERNQSALDGETARESERLGFFAHELRNLINTAIIAFEVLETGNVGSRTNAVVSRVETAAQYSGRSSSEARIEPAWLLASPSADGALKPTMAGSIRATCLVTDASLSSTCRGSRFPRSRSLAPVRVETHLNWRLAPSLRRRTGVTFFRLPGDCPAWRFLIIEPDWPAFESLAQSTGLAGR